MKTRAPESYRVTHTLGIDEYVLEHEGDIDDADEHLCNKVDWKDVYDECIDSIMSTIDSDIGYGQISGEVVIDLDEEGVDVGLPDCVLRVEWSIEFDSITEW